MIQPLLICGFNLLDAQRADERQPVAVMLPDERPDGWKVWLGGLQNEEGSPCGLNLSAPRRPEVAGESPGKDVEAGRLPRSKHGTPNPPRLLKGGTAHQHPRQRRH